MRAFCVTWERRAVGNGCFFSVLVGFERRASNGVKRAFFVEAAMKNGGAVLGAQNVARCGTAEPVRNRVNRTEK